MASRPTVSGWSVPNADKPNEYSSEFRVDGRTYANVTNLTTGQRQLYLVSGIAGTFLTNRKLVMTTNSDGTKDPGPDYNSFVRQYGQNALTNAEINNKKQSQFIISKASTAEERASLSKSKEYKSSSNAASGTTAGGSPNGGDQQGGSGASDSNTSPDDEENKNNENSGAIEIAAGTPFGDIQKEEAELAEKSLKFAPTGGLRYPLNLSARQDRIEITALRLLEREGAKNPTPTVPSTTPSSGTQPTSGSAPPPSSQTPGTPPPTTGSGQRPTPGQPTTGAGTSNTSAATEPPVNLQFTFGKPKYVPVDETIRIAIQAPISDQNTVEWGSGEANAMASAAYDIAINATTSGLSEKVLSKLEGILGTGIVEKDRIRRYLSGEAASISNILARTDNVVLNPNLELLFSGPALRSFNLTFKMTAREENESKAIRYIINYFKYHMAARDTDTGTPGLFLRAPHVFEIKYKYGETQDHPSISRIKTPCALTNISVDYTPLGTYSTYRDGSMIAYIINLQFQELTPIYSSDYSKFEYSKNTENANIGY